MVSGNFRITLPSMLGLLSARLTGKEKKWKKFSFVFFICALTQSILLSGCAPSGLQTRPTFEEANKLFGQGNYKASLGAYEQLIEYYPESKDRVLFEMGIIYSYPNNNQKDYQKSLECFRKLVQDHPGSPYRRDSEMMIFNISNVVVKDKVIAEHQTLIVSLRQEIKIRDSENAGLQEKVALTRQIAVDFALGKRSVDRILVEKKERRLTLFSNGDEIKTYKIALGGNPNGPKERQGDHKTPEGHYIIDSKNRNSKYHLALHISYPNENDRRRSRREGVALGGDIMIHGLKKGFSWVDESHADIDWTQGCIAVTNGEIEEIFKLVPLGTDIEIRP